MAGKGRPRKPGERTPCGALKRRAHNHELTPAAWKRIKLAGGKLATDPHLGSELGRLGCIGTLTDAEVAAGFKVGAIYARFERSLPDNVRRTTQSPSYSNAFRGGVNALSGGMSDNDGPTAKSAFDRLQDEISGFPRTARAALERLCVDDRAIPGELPGVKAILAHLARRWRIIPKPKAQSAFVSQTLDVLELSSHGRELVLACYQRAADIQTVELNWNDGDWQTINKLRVWYLHGATAERFSPDYEEQRASFVESICDSLTGFLQFVEGRASVPDDFWQLMGSAYPDYQRDRVHDWVKDFRDKAKSLDGAFKTVAAKSAIDAQHSPDSMSKLVRRLADHFRTKGLRPTASDMYTREDPDPSPFVDLVAVVINTLPEALWPDFQSTGSFSKEISKILSSHKPKATVGKCETTASS